jgi:hypothetical protein
MKSISHYLIVTILYIFCTSLSAQDDNFPFTVKLGSFVNPKSSDFAEIRSLGFIYAVERPTGDKDIFSGGFADNARAEKAAQIMKARGFIGASISRMNIEGGKPVVVIQLTTKGIGESINWEELSQFGEVYFLLADKQIKLFTGIYTNNEAARQALNRIKEKGYSSAFVKTVNNVLLHKAGDFETGGLSKKPLIPLDFTSKPMEPDTQTTTEPSKEGPRVEPVLTAKGAPVPPPTPTTKSTTTTTASNPVKETPVVKPAAVTKPAPPVNTSSNTRFIRANVKRSSATELQKVLKTEGFYKSSVDGYYGNGTRAAFEMALKTNRQLLKYRVIATSASNVESQASRGSLQYFINNLWEESTSAIKGLEGMKQPLAKAYRAYFRFATEGSNAEVNKLMNEAIREAFSGKKVSYPKFNPGTNYTYLDLDQLLLHLRYINEAATDNPSVPCWMFSRHTSAALRAFEPQGNGSKSDLRKMNCGGFWDWEEVKILNAITDDVSGQGQIQNTADASLLSQLYLSPRPIDDAQRKALEIWNDNLWKGLNGWASRDPYFSEITTALKIAYFQTQVLLEDYFLDARFSEGESKAMALAAMKALVGKDLERFI